MGQTEVYICIGGFRVRSGQKFNFRILLFYNDFTGFCQTILAFFIIVIKLD